MAETRSKLNASKSGGGTRDGQRGTPNWVMRGKYAPTGDNALPGRIIPCAGDDPFFTYYERWVGPDGSKRPIISNSRNGEIEVPDLLYYAAAQTEDPTLLAKPVHAITFLVLDWYHNVQKAGKKTNKDGNIPLYDNFIRCRGVTRLGKSNCDICNAEAQKQAENEAAKKAGTPLPHNILPKVFGQRTYLKLSGKQKAELLTELAKLKDRCCTCGEGEINRIQYDCPECKKIILNRYTEHDVTDEDLHTLDNETVECPNCAKAVTAVPVLECAVRVGNEYVSKCKNPRQLPASAGLFGVDISLAIRAYVPVIDSFRETGTYADLPANMTEPLPLRDFLSYMTLKEQAVGMNTVNPFGDEGERVLLAHFQKTLPTEPVVASEAGAAEADPDSINWGKK